MWRAVRLVIVLTVLAVGLVIIGRTRADPGRVTLFITATIGGVTAIYALITYEMLLQNRSMAQAATDSVRVMERSLRFSFAPNLLFRTLNTKDPSLKGKEEFTAIDNEDYKRALREYSGERQKEFIFAIIQNVGRGSATNLTVAAQYNVWDTSSPNAHYSLHKDASIQLLEAGKAVALCVYVSKLPTADDRVELVSATIGLSDFYRDALDESAQQIRIDPAAHHIETEADCVVRIA
jgi:hypothetical protein